MKRIFLFLALLLEASSIARAQTPDAATLLNDVLRAERTAQFSGVESDGDAKFNIWRDGRKRRIEWLAPPVRRGDILVDNGANVWLFHKQENAAIQTKSTPQRDEPVQVHEVRVNRSEVVAGRRSWVVEIKGRANNAVVSRIWIDASTKIVLRRENVGRSGAGAKREFESISFGKVAPSLFQWTPPQGAELTRTSGTLFVQLNPARLAASWLGVPGFVPGGYAFESAVVDKGEAWLRFSSGARRFSIFQQRVQDAGEKPLTKVDGGVYWQRGGSRFLAVGLPENIARRVAQSIP